MVGNGNEGTELGEGDVDGSDRSSRLGEWDEEGGNGNSWLGDSDNECDRDEKGLEGFGSTLGSFIFGV